MKPVRSLVPRVNRQATFASGEQALPLTVTGLLAGTTWPAPGESTHTAASSLGWARPEARRCMPPAITAPTTLPSRERKVTGRSLPTVAVTVHTTGATATRAVSASTARVGPSRATTMRSRCTWTSVTTRSPQALTWPRRPASIVAAFAAASARAATVRRPAGAATYSR
ncbi:hypothetical protein QK900_07745 [Arsenicicoccus dermatophilus]